MADARIDDAESALIEQPLSQFLRLDVTVRCQARPEPSIAPQIVELAAEVSEVVVVAGDLFAAPADLEELNRAMEADFGLRGAQLEGRVPRRRDRGR